MPGNASTLLIWLGKSLRPVATIAAYRWAIAGGTSGVGLARAKMIPPGAIPASALSSMAPPETPISTSAPISASAMPPVRPEMLVVAASSALIRGEVAALGVDDAARVADDHVGAL